MVVVVVSYFCKTLNSSKHLLILHENVSLKGWYTLCAGSSFSSVPLLTTNRVVHAQAAGARGYFEVTHDISDITSAKFLQVGTKTPALVRISTVGGERGSSDTVRDVRGWGIKLFTTEGNQDWVFNHIVSHKAYLSLRPELSFLAGLLRQRPNQVSFLEPIT